jgi:transcriptional regulator with XRE-family HTH domain
MITLESWMRDNGHNDASLADAVGVTRPYISRLRAGDVSPSLEQALKIFKFTKGKVPLEQLLPGHARPNFTRPVRIRGPKRKDNVQKPPARRASQSRASA